MVTWRRGRTPTELDGRVGDQSERVMCRFSEPREDRPADAVLERYMAIYAILRNVGFGELSLPAVRFPRKHCDQARTIITFLYHTIKD